MWAHKTNIYKLCPYKYIMVYHEVRIKGNHSYNYIIHNAREDGKWKKKSKFIGNGRLSKKKIEEEIERFKLKMNKYISEENHKKIEEIRLTPYGYKFLRTPLNGFNRVHIDSHFVLIFRIDHFAKSIILYYFDHHDEVYKWRPKE